MSISTRTGRGCLTVCDIRAMLVICVRWEYELTDDPVLSCYARMELDVVGRTVLGVELDHLKSADQKRE